MKLCLICFAQNASELATCVGCGEASFTANERAAAKIASSASSTEAAAEMSDAEWAELETATAPTAEPVAPSRKRR